MEANISISLDIDFVDGSEAVVERGEVGPERRHDWLHGQHQQIVQHGRDELVEHLGTVVSDGRVGVDLNQPELEVAVDHEIHAEDLKVEGGVGVGAEASGCEFLPAGLQHVDVSVVHLCPEVFPDGAAFAGSAVLLVDVLFEEGFGEFVAFFVPAVACGLSLDGIVGEVHQSTRRRHVEGFAGGADVAVLVAVESELAVDEGDQHVAADVELALVVEEGRDVALQDEATGLGLLALAHPPAQLLHSGSALLRHCDASAPVRILPWFDDPVQILLPLAHPPHRLVRDEPQLIGLRHDLQQIPLLDRKVLLHVGQQILLVADAPVLGEVVVHQQVLPDPQLQHLPLACHLDVAELADLLRGDQLLEVTQVALFVVFVELRLFLKPVGLFLWPVGAVGEGLGGARQFLILFGLIPLMEALAEDGLPVELSPDEVGVVGEFDYPPAVPPADQHFEEFAVVAVLDVDVEVAEVVGDGYLDAVEQADGALDIAHRHLLLTIIRVEQIQQAVFDYRSRIPSRLGNRPMLVRMTRTLLDLFGRICALLGWFCTLLEEMRQVLVLAVVRE